MTEPTILWDVNPKFRTGSWAEAVPTTPRAATVDLYIFDRSYSAFQVAGDCTIRRWLQNWNRHADNLLLIARLAPRTPYSDLCHETQALRSLIKLVLCSTSRFNFEPGTKKWSVNFPVSAAMKFGPDIRIVATRLLFIFPLLYSCRWQGELAMFSLQA